MSTFAITHETVLYNIGSPLQAAKEALSDLRNKDKHQDFSVVNMRTKQKFSVSLNPNSNEQTTLNELYDERPLVGFNADFRVKVRFSDSEWETLNGNKLIDICGLTWSLTRDERFYVVVVFVVNIKQVPYLLGLLDAKK